MLVTPRLQRTRRGSAPCPQQTVTRTHGKFGELKSPLTFRLVQRGEDWIVPSQGGKGSYRVNLGEQHCTCPDHETNGNRCKHIIAAEIVYRRETAPDGTVTETKAVRLTYSQDWAAYNAAA